MNPANKRLIQIVLAVHGGIQVAKKIVPYAFAFFVVTVLRNETLPRANDNDRMRA